MGKRWEGPIAHENQETGDDRCLAAGALSWAAPFPINWTHAEGAEMVAVAQMTERRDGGVIWGSGVFLDTPEGLRRQQECEAAQAAGLNWGISVDLDDVSLELRVREEVLAEQASMLAALFGDEENVEEEEPADENGRVKVAEIHSGDYMTVVTSARIRAASVVTIPAFIGAHITILSDESSDATNATALGADIDPFSTGADIDPFAEVLSLVASVYPVAPPSAWFTDMAFTEKTPIVVTDEGEIYGHGATWDTFHIGFAGQRIDPPRSMANYGYFRLGYIVTAEGESVPIGKITMTTGHAEDGLSALDTMAHYDNTGAVVADVVCGEDEFGIWVHGALRPGVTDEQVRELRAAPLSGDWREIRGNLELVGLLAVNVPGFAVPRMGALVAGGAVRSLVASAAFGEVIQDVVLTREEKLALKELVAERQNGAENGSVEATEVDLVAAALGTKTERAAKAKRAFRIEQARERAAKAKGK